jgi:hypothetical protein
MMKVRPGAIAREPGFSTVLALGIIGKLEAGLPVSRQERGYALAWVEDALAREGIALVTAATARIGKRVAACENVSLSELESALYDIWSGALGKYFQPPEWQEAELEPA